MKHKNMVLHLALSAILLVTMDQCFMFIHRDRYRTSVQHVQATEMQPRVVGWVVAYVSITAALYWFILRQRRPVWEAMLLGLWWNAAFEGFLYGIFHRWRLDVAVLDTVWGSVLLGLTTAMVYAVDGN